MVTKQRTRHQTNRRGQTPTSAWKSWILETTIWARVNLRVVAVNTSAAPVGDAGATLPMCAGVPSNAALASFAHAGCSQPADVALDLLRVLEIEELVAHEAAPELGHSGRQAGGDGAGLVDALQQSQRHFGC